mgnify:CR=1 FL=1
MKRNRSGFTLMEVMVTSIILILFGAIVFNGFKTAVPAYRLKAAARELYSNLHRTKMIAIKNNTKCTVSYSTDPDQYYLSGVTKTVTLRDYGGGIRFLGPQGQTFSVSTITFNSRGTCNAGYAYLTDEKNSAFYRVGPWSTGIIQLQTYASGDWD